MLKLKDKIDVLMSYFKHGESIRKIAKKTGFSRNTIREYIRDFERKREALLKENPSMNILSIIDTIVESPIYDSSTRTSQVMKDEFIEKIKKYLSDNEFKKENGIKKQCMTAQDIHEALLEIGFTGSYPTTCIYVRKCKNTTNEAFIKQTYEFGDTCEFDWGDVKLRDNNKIRIFKIAVFTSAKTNYRIAFLYHREDTQAFIDAHVRFFEITNGAFKTMVYDNMRVAVAKFVGLHEKEATEALKKLSLFYGFRFRFCNIHSGNEKGHVERSVDVVRRKAFSKSLDYSFSQAEKQLEDTLLRHNKNKFDDEAAYLLPYPGKYETAVIKECFVDKYSTIAYLGNRYSVPDSLVGKYVTLKAYISNVTVNNGKDVVSTHSRLYGQNEWSVNILHYIRTLTRKPGALNGSLALMQLQDDLKSLYINNFKQSPKEFVKVMELIGDLGKEIVLSKVNDLKLNHIPINLDNIKAVSLRHEEKIDDNEIAVSMLMVYDSLFNAGRTSKWIHRYQI